MPDADLIASGYETVESYRSIGCEAFGAAGARFVRNRDWPDRYDANHVDNVRAETPQQIEALLRRVEVEYAGYRHRRFNIGPSTPPQFTARLLQDGGYTWNEGLYLVLEGELKASPKPADIRLVQDESQWQALHDLNALWLEMFPPETRAPLQQTNAYNRARSPAVRWWLAYVDGVPRAFFNSWQGENGVGQVEDLFTHPEYRHRGLATSLLAHCADDARKHGAGPIIIGCDPSDTPKHMYEAMGWRPLFTVRHALRRLD